MPESTRICSACGEAKSLDQFPRYGKCRDCLNAYGREYRRKNPERMRELDAQSYRRHAESKKASDRAHYAANRDRRQAKARETYATEDREARNAVRKAWREANRHRFVEYTKRYREKNPAVTITTNNNRRSRLAGSKVSLAELQSLWTGSCALCGESMDLSLAWPDPLSKSIDHIVPLARGGPHVAANLQWAHLRCNRRKSDKIL